jgi:hypothetical protein
VDQQRKHQKLMHEHDPFVRSNDHVLRAGL